MTSHTRPLAIVTGASAGIGYELAKCCAAQGFDLLIAADRPAIDDAAQDFRALGAAVEALLANAGHGLGHGFLDQDFDAVRHIIDTNITGTLSLIQHVGREMRTRDRGRILITGSVAGFMPGTFQAVYGGTKAFLNSFAFALRNELKDTHVTVTCLMPGATETEFFERADMLTPRWDSRRRTIPRMSLGPASTRWCRARATSSPAGRINCKRP
jgi:short-subunit dehydrogenase